MRQQSSIPMEDSIKMGEVWTAAAVLIGFQVTVFLWRLQRELELARRKGPNWFPPADYLNLFSLLTASLVLVLPTIIPAMAARGAARVLALSVILFVGYPFALVGHYGLLFTGEVDKLPGKYSTLAEKIIFVLTGVAAISYLFFSIICRGHIYFH
jgi:hypothetical protein